MAATLNRPVGELELDLVEASGWKWFPPRLDWQPILYPLFQLAEAAGSGSIDFVAVCARAPHGMIAMESALTYWEYARMHLVSDTFLRLISTDPQWEPTEGQARQALVVLAALAPRAVVCEIERHADVVFVDQGVNFEGLACPSCGSTLGIDWFHDQMDRPDFDNLAVVAPCCGVQTSLNDLDFRWPAGFSRFVLTAMDPGRERLAGSERHLVEEALGHSVREIWARY